MPISGLALARDVQQGLREDLKLLVMSATLDGARVAALLGDAPVVESEGRAFPVETRYLGRDARARIERQVADAVAARACAPSQARLLVFLPGAGEIRRTETLLKERVADATVDIVALYGALDAREQDRAISPAPAGRRKVVLATSIAETSLTIEGVRVVIDSGLSRVPRYEPDVGLTRLETVRVSRAAADQRRGRAGRTEPGVCYRLWDEPQTGSLEPYTRPEILSADLSSFVLDLAQWGASDPGKLAFLDPPPQAALGEAKALLSDLERAEVAEQRLRLAAAGGGGGSRKASLAGVAGAHGARSSTKRRGRRQHHFRPVQGLERAGLRLLPQPVADARLGAAGAAAALIGGGARHPHRLRAASGRRPARSAAPATCRCRWTTRTPSMVSEVSAIEVASTTLRRPGGAGDGRSARRDRSCQEGGYVDGSGRDAMPLASSASMRRIHRGRAGTPATEPRSARTRDDRVGDGRIEAAPRVAAEITRLDRKGAALALDDRGAAEQRGDARPVERRRHDETLRSGRRPCWASSASARPRSASSERS